MDAIEAKCPGCGSVYDLGPEYWERNVECPKCEATFFVESSRAGACGAPVAPRAPDPIAAPEDGIPAEWQIGDAILDLYEVKQIHEGGGMGLVYRVHHRGWNTDLAVKSPRAEYFATEEQKENFTRECEAWINLGLHPHIVSCHYVRRLGGIPRVFAEYVEGGSLAEWVQDRRLYEGGPDRALGRILDIAIQTAWGLHHAHECGLIHQDVKPGNMLMQSDGTAKITDFGLAKARATSGEFANAGPGRSVLVSTGGMTPAYCSPEQAAREPLTRRTDIWSWALSVVEMFTGEVTWQSGVAAAQVLESIEELRAEDVALPSLPDDLRRLLERCFEMDPAQRPKDFAEITARLKEIYRTEQGAEYARSEPAVAELRADALNNRAVSLLDLGKRDEALGAFEQALAVEPHQSEATYNRALLLWRSARMTDQEPIEQIVEASRAQRANWQSNYLLGLLHLERGDPWSAIDALHNIAKDAAGAPSYNSVLRAARLAAQAMGPRVQAFEGHMGTVSSVAFSPDGHLILSGSHDKTLRLWNVESGDCLRRFERQEHSINVICFSPDGRHALSGATGESFIRLWEVATGKCVRTFDGRWGKILAVAFSPKGQFVLASGAYRPPRIWDVASGNCLRTFEGHAGSVNSVTFSRDGNLILSGGEDGTLRLWNVETGECLRTFKGHSSEVASVSFSPNCCHALSADFGRTLRLWNVETGECLRIFSGANGKAAFSPDGRYALSSTPMRLWEVSTARCLHTFGPSATAVAFSPDGRLALSGHGDENVRLWKVPLDFSPAPLCLCVPLKCEAIAQVADQVGKLIASAQSWVRRGDAGEAYRNILAAMAVKGYARDNCLLSLRRKIGLLGRAAGFADAWHSSTFDGHSSTACGAFSPDGRFVLSGSDDESLRLWDVATGKCLRTFQGQVKSVARVAFSYDGRLALSGGRIEAIQLWEVATGKCLHTFKGHSWLVNAVAFSPDGRFALSGSHDKPIQFWDVATGRCARVLDKQTDKANSFAFSPDGRLVLSASLDDALRLWEIASGQCLRVFKAHTDPGSPTPVSLESYLAQTESVDQMRLRISQKVVCRRADSLAFSPDAQFAVSGHYDKVVRLWELATAKCLRTFEGHENPVYSVAFSPDGHYILSGSAEGRRLWEATSGECLRIFTGGYGPIAFSPDGRFGLSALRLWEFVWNHTFPDPVHWDEKAKPHLEIFLTLHCAVGEDGFSRLGKPVWTDEDFQKLIVDLQYRGYGWLRPEGVRRKLEQMTAEWQGPPPLPGAEA
ncbi:MAG TPA: protein kinase [Verrucomicrobiae bacterium]|nr:protein kinase [Verrucomicrobiae bacterium]